MDLPGGPRYRIGPGLALPAARSNVYALKAAMFRDLGAAVYGERTSRGGTDTADKIERLVKALSRQEAEQGLGDTDAPRPGF